MMIEGSVFRSGKFWVASIPALDASTQARTRSALPAMISDLISSLCDARIRTDVSAISARKLAIEVQDDALLFPQILKRQREKNGLSQREAARLLGYSSTNAYSAYEQGQRRPSLDKAEKLLRAVGGKKRLRLAIG